MQCSAQKTTKKRWVDEVKLTERQEKGGLKGQVAEVRLNALHWRVTKVKSKVGKVGDYWGNSIGQKPERPLAKLVRSV